jgi:hypothetical protein
MKKNAGTGKNRLACFQWIRDIRADMSRDMAGMTLEERAAYLEKRHKEAQKGRSRPSPAQARRRRNAVLYPDGAGKNTSL